MILLTSRFTRAIPQNPKSKLARASPSTDIHSPLSKAFDEEILKERLTEEFGPYLLQYPNAKIDVQGERLDPASLLSNEKSIVLPPSVPGEVRLKLVEWQKTSERRIFLCAKDGTTLAEVPMRSHLLDGYVNRLRQFRLLPDVERPRPR